MSDVVTRFFQQQRKHRMLGMQRAPQIRPLSESPVPLTGKNRIAARRAGWRGYKRMFKQHTFTSNPIERWRLHHKIAVRPSMWPAPIVCNAKQDVGALCRITAGRNKSDTRDANDEGHHALYTITS
jgi:hypothetical protein